MDSAGPPEPGTVLVVEDDDVTRAFLLDNLAADGFRVAGASGAGEGLRAIEVRQPALVVLDLVLEDGSGLALLDRVRASDGLSSRIDPDLPVIVLSGRAGDADRVRSFARGADDHVTKPTRSFVLRVVEPHRGWALTDAGHEDLVATPASGRMLGRVAIRLVLAEDSYLVREGIRRLLETQPEIELVGTCGDLDSLLGAVETERPDAVLTDIRMPPSWQDEGIRAAQRLRDTSPQVGVIVLSQYVDPGYAIALLESGSERRAYLLKERVEDLEQLVSTIRAVAAGGSVIDPKVVEALVEAKTAGERSPLSELTPREHEVLREMAQGRNNAAIAESLVITERSVEKYVHSIFAKLGLAWEDNVHRRVKAVLVYLGEDQ